MVDLEERVQRLEDKVKDLEININKSLAEIKVSLSEIKTTLQGNSSNGDLKNDLIRKDVQANTERIGKVEEKVKEQEDSKRWLVRLVFGTIIGLVFEAVALYLKTK